MLVGVGRSSAVVRSTLGGALRAPGELAVLGAFLRGGPSVSWTAGVGFLELLTGVKLGSLVRDALLKAVAVNFDKLIFDELGNFASTFQVTSRGTLSSFTERSCLHVLDH